MTHMLELLAHKDSKIATSTMLKDVRANMLGFQLKKDKKRKNKLYFKKERENQTQLKKMKNKMSETRNSLDGLNCILDMTE